MLLNSLLRPLGSLTLALLPALAVAQTPLHQFSGDVNTDKTGSSVAGGGDVNGDGLDDVVVGSPGDLDGGGIATGSVTVYSGADGTVLHQFFGDVNGDAFGDSVAGVGDLNADGFDDFAAATGLNETSGYARFYSGVDGTLLFQHTSIEPPGFSGGLVVAAAGDVDGNGFDDVVVGTPLASSNGEVVVLSGSGGGTIHTWLGTLAGDGYGASVAGAGDVNDDGFCDLIIGAKPMFPVFPGYVEVRSGLDATILYRYAFLDPSSPVFVGPGVGGAVAGVGDLDWDGFDDFVIGDASDGTTTIQAGRALVLSGADGALMFQRFGSSVYEALGTSVAGAGDVDGDRFNDIAIGAPRTGLSLDAGEVIVISGADGSDLMTIGGSANSERFGVSVGCTGDLDDDGFPELVVGAPTFVTNQGPGSASVLSLDFVGTPSREIISGSPCPLTSPRVPRIGYDQRTFIDDTVRITLRGGSLDLGNSTLFIGRDTPVPLDLLGLTGCTLFTTDIWGEALVSRDAIGRASLDIPFPNDPVMIGLSFVSQWVTADFTSPFSLPLTFSDRLKLVIGG